MASSIPNCISVWSASFFSSEILIMPVAADQRFDGRITLGNTKLVHQRRSGRKCFDS